MLPAPLSYILFPSVVPAGKVSKMTICAAEPAYMMPEGKEYTLKIITVNSDDSYYDPQTHKILTLQASQGVLQFDFLFESEQEHLVQLISDDTVIDTFSVFSAYEDLYALTPLRGDLHSHSCRSDGTRDPASQAGHYREQGYDFVALTDHNRFYPGDEIDTIYQGVNTGLTRVSGEEVHCPGSVVHIVHIGGKESVAARFIHDPEAYEKEIDAYLEKVPNNVPEIYKTRYAKAMWATDAIHAVGGLAIFPHPFWRPNKSKIFNVCDDFAKILLKSGMFDAYEVIGAMTQDDNNRSVAFWGDLRAEGLKISVVGSSDIHNLRNYEHFPGHFTICFAKENTNDAIVEAIKNGLSVAVETAGFEPNKQYRCYGSTRLVTYAHFLLKYYFPKLQRLTAGAGVAMRAYTMEDTTAELINMHTQLADKFTKRFFGRIAPILPSEKLLSFEQKAREAQLTKGPKTRGSSITAAPAKNLI